jgi:hypothetical protein
MAVNAPVVLEPAGESDLDISKRVAGGRLGGAVTLAAVLERDRLEERAVRLGRVVTALRARARAYDATTVPQPLRHSLSDFQRELDAVRDRLARGR